MATLSVVVLEPRCKCGCAVVVGVEAVAVGPFGLQGAVEPFDLAVLPGAVDFDEDLVETEFFMHEKEIGLPILSAVVVWNRFQYQPFDGRSEIIVSEEVE